MNTVQKCLFGGALLGAGLSSTAVAGSTAAIHIEDTLEFTNTPDDVSDGTYNMAFGPLEVHTIDFSVLSDGNVQIDMLSWNIFGAFFDTQITLFSNDGNPLSNANYIQMSDYTSGSDFNGSIDSFDSFMDIFLTAGDYTVAVGANLFSASDAEAGVGFGTVSSNISPAVAQTGGQYELDIYGDVSLPGVPTPGALALLGLGGLAATRRRR